MSISMIEGINAAANLSQLAANKTVDKSEVDFSQWLENEIAVANKQINDADLKLREFAIGKTDNVHDVMMSLEKAKTSFELIVEVRNRLLEGYQEIMRMQI